MLTGVPQAEEKKQECPFRPFSQECRTQRRGQHQYIGIEAPLKQAATIGIWTLVLLLLGRLSLADAVKRATKKLNFTGRSIIVPYAEAAMDVDKSHQLEMLRADMEK